jgi:hypothetical protein
LSNWKGMSQSATGFNSQDLSLSGSCRCDHLLVIWFSRKPVVEALDRLSATVLLQSEHLGVCSMWTILLRYAQIRCTVLMKMDADSSPFINRFWWPNTQAILSVLKIMCWFASFSGISKNGRRIPICSRVAVLLPKRAPFSSFSMVIKGFGHQIW